MVVLLKSLFIMKFWFLQLNIQLDLAVYRKEAVILKRNLRI